MKSTTTGAVWMSNVGGYRCKESLATDKLVREQINSETFL